MLEGDTLFKMKWFTMFLTANLNLTRFRMYKLNLYSKIKKPALNIEGWIVDADHLIQSLSHLSMALFKK